MVEKKNPDPGNAAAASDPQQVNRDRLQAAKEADRTRQTVQAQRDAAEEKPVTVTLDGGTKVTAEKDVADRVKG